MKTFSLLLLSVLLSYSSFAQTECYESITSESLISMADDQDFIWCGTEENGLLRINKESGEKTYWNKDNSDMKSNRIKSVTIYNDKLYLSSDSTVLQLHNEEIEIVHEDIEGLLLEDGNGDLLIAGRRDFYKMNSDEALTYHQVLTDVVADQCCSQNTDMAIDADGNVWISHWDFYEYDIIKYDGNEWSVYDITNSNLPIESPGPNQITTVENKVYASNYSGVYSYEGNDWTNITASISNAEENVEDLIAMTIKSDTEGLLWLAADDMISGKTEKIAFSIAGEWSFIDNEGNDFPKVNFFQESQSDANLVYAGTNVGLIIFDRSCLLPIINVAEIDPTNEFEVYPIPCDQFLQIESDEKIDRIEIYDLSGQIVVQQTQVLQNIPIKSLSSGVYVLKIYSSEKLFVKRILKE